VIGSIGWITGTSCEHPGACYPTRVALTCAADETYAWSCGRCRFSGRCRPIRRENEGVWRR
jgi:hypothetical protein